MELTQCNIQLINQDLDTSISIKSSYTNMSISKSVGNPISYWASPSISSISCLIQFDSHFNFIHPSLVKYRHTHPLPETMKQFNDQVLYLSYQTDKIDLDNSGQTKSQPLLCYPLPPSASL